MKHQLFASGVLLLLSVQGFAQSPSFTFPKGFNSTAGNASFFGGSDRRFMGIDATQLGTVALFKSFALRRKSGAALTTSANVTLELGESNMSPVYSQMDLNYRSGSRKLVFPRRLVNWTLPAAPSTPAPFDLKVSFGTPHISLGLHPMLWDLKLETVSRTFSLDRDYQFYTSRTAATLGAGCGNFRQVTSMETNGPAMSRFGMRLRISLNSAPPSVPVGLSFAATNSNALVPGLCARVYAIPLLVMPMGVSSSTGVVYYNYFNAPFTAAAQGLKLVTQAYAPSAGGLVLSDGKESVMPSSSQTNGHDSLYIWSPLTRTPNNGTAFHGGSILVQMGT